MGLSLATLAGFRVTDAHVTIPAWGCPYAEVVIDGEHPLAGRVDLVLADLVMSCTVLSGGPALGRSMYRLVGGAGGWGKTIKGKNYVDAAGVALSKVLGDAAADAGETVVVGADVDVGVAWNRQAGPASTQLNLLAPRAWYVDGTGTTRLGARPAGQLVGQVTRVTPADLARGKVVLAAASIASILPGVVVDGIVAVDVLHELTPSTGLRSTVWGRQAPSTLDSLSALLRQLDPDRDYRGFTEYRVDTFDGDAINVQPVRVSSGHSYQKSVPVWPGVGGAKTKPALASRVLVGFIEADPSRPFIGHFEDSASATSLSLVTDGIGAGGHAVTLEQVINLFVNYTAVRYTLGDLGSTFSPVYAAAPPATLASMIVAMIAGCTTPIAPGLTPGGLLDAIGLPAAVEAALLLQVPDPASLGLPSPVIPGLAKKGFLV
jgi:hypothetical protein